MSLIYPNTSPAFWGLSRRSDPPASFRPGIDAAIALADAMLCADCDTLTPAALGRCVCGSEQRIPMARFVRPVGGRSLCAA